MPERVGAGISLLSAVGLDLPPLEPGRSGEPGLFGPTSQVWRIGRERLLLAGGAAALLLQIAHPLVAAGVAEHSDFPLQAFDRLRSTLDATLRITFGDRDQALEAAAQIHSTHDRVRGTLAETVGSHPAGTAYDASDPELALWIHATLIVTALGTYERLVGGLAPEARRRYYEEAKAFAALFGVGDRVIPPTYAAFLEYVRSMVEGDLLVVGLDALALSREIVNPPVPMPLLPARPLNRIVTAGQLPERLRVQFRLPWGPAERSGFASFAAGCRAMTALMPGAVRFWPHYRVAERRVSRPTESRPTPAAVTRSATPRSPRRSAPSRRIRPR